MKLSEIYLAPLTFTLHPSYVVPAMRIILILVVLGGLVLLLAFNLEPVSLVFLGMSSPNLPLAVWILLSTAAGAFTSLLITAINRILTASSSRSRRYQKAAVPPPQPPRSVGRSTTQSTYTTSETAKSNRESTSNNDDLDDWDSELNGDDWDLEASTDNQQRDRPPEQPSDTKDARESKDYEVHNEPKSSYRSGSVYSYGYREPSNSGVGKTESVYDADYRVLTPPYRQIDTEPGNTDPEDDDWGLDDDDFFEDEGESNAPKKN